MTMDNLASLNVFRQNWYGNSLYILDYLKVDNNKTILNNNSNFFQI